MNVSLFARVFVDSRRVQTVGIVSPGAMGSAVADALARGGARVVATVAGRSERTARLAEQARLELLPDLGAVVTTADVVLSIVPPEAAESVAEDVARQAQRGWCVSAGGRPERDRSRDDPPARRCARSGGLRVRRRVDLGAAAVERRNDAHLLLRRAGTGSGGASHRGSRAHRRRPRGRAPRPP